MIIMMGGTPRLMDFLKAIVEQLKKKGMEVAVMHQIPQKDNRTPGTFKTLTIWTLVYPGADPKTVATNIWEIMGKKPQIGGFMSIASCINPEKIKIGYWTIESTPPL